MSVGAVLLSKLRTDDQGGRDRRPDPSPIERRDTGAPRIASLAGDRPFARLLALGAPQQGKDEAPARDLAPSAGAALRQEMLAFIDGHLEVQDLGPGMLAQRFRISRSHLYRVFAADGGVAGIVRDRRLDAACRELLRREAPARSITEISYRLGFSSSNQFLRAFRARFGATPTQMRRDGLAGLTARSAQIALEARLSPSRAV